MKKLLESLLLAAVFTVQPILSASAQTVPAFTIMETPNLDSNDHLYGISALAPNDVWAVGFYTSFSGKFLNLAMHWDGNAWTITPTPNPSQPAVDQLKSVLAIASNNVWAIGGHGLSYSLRWDGSQWSEVDLPPIVNRGFVDVSNNLEDLAGTSSSDIWAVGSMDSLEGGFWTLTVHWNGTEWIQVPSPNKSAPGGPVYTQTLRDAIAFAPNDVWAVGFYLIGNVKHTLVQHWDGNQWSIVPSPDGPTGDGGLNGISGTSSSDIWVVGEHDNATYYAMAKALAMHWNGTAWSVVLPPNPSSWGVSPLNSVLARSPNDVYAVGQWENPTQGLSTFVVHWDGAGWTQVSSENPPGNGTGWNSLYEITQDPTGGLWTSGAKQGSFGDLTFSLVERASTAAMTDTVSVTQATYLTSRKKLQIAATTTASDATLTAYVTSTDALIGTLAKQGTRYVGKFSWPTNPVNITVKSSAGGTASKAVVAR